MNMKKAAALLLTVVMMFALVAACEIDTDNPAGTPTVKPGDNGDSGDNGNSGEKSDRQLLVEKYGLEWEGEPEDITFTIFIGGTGKPPAPGNPVVELLYQITGVRLEFEFVVQEPEARIGTMTASGNYPDFIGGSAANIRAMLIEAEAFVPVDDLLPNYPRLWEHFEPYLDRLRNVAPDNTIRILDAWGRNYFMNDGLDTDHMDEYNGPAWWIQKDVIAFNNYVAPTTLDEFFDLLARYYAEYPEIDGQPTLPFEIYSKTDSNYAMKNPPMHLVGMRNEGDAVVLQRDPIKVEIHDNKWYAKEYYKALNDAYNNGLINPATFERTSDQYQAAISQGRVLAMFEQQWHSPFSNGEGVLVDEGKLERTYVAVGLTLPGYESQLFVQNANDGLLGGNGVGITKSCKDVDRALKFMEQLLTPEIHTLLYWGIEDEHYYVDENGRFRRTPEQKANWDNKDWRDENAGITIIEPFPKIQGRLPDGNAWNSGSQPEERIENMHPKDKEFYDNLGFYRRDGFLEYVESPGYPELWDVRVKLLPADEKFRDVFDAIQEIAERYLILVVMADSEDFEAEWDSYVARFEEIDYDYFERTLEAKAEELRFW